MVQDPGAKTRDLVAILIVFRPRESGRGDGDQASRHEGGGGAGSSQSVGSGADGTGSERSTRSKRVI
ncbi:MAG: hypothetical protein ACJAVK_003668 [Akkermansiaceae bacterium]|jgi:hypothetical protein